MAPAIFFLQKSTKKTTFCISLVIYAYRDTYARVRYILYRKKTDKLRRFSGQRWGESNLVNKDLHFTHLSQLYKTRLII